MLRLPLQRIAARSSRLFRPIRMQLPVIRSFNQLHIPTAGPRTYLPDLRDAHSDEDMEEMKDLVSFSDITLEEILARKKARLGDVLHTVNENDLVFTAIGKMDQFGIGALLVTNDNGEIKGIFSERDYLRKVALKGKWSRSTHVRDVMTRNPVFARAGTMSLDALRAMSEHRFRHMPVVADEETSDGKTTSKVIGLVSVGDLLATMLSELKNSTKYLQNLVSGKYPG